MKEEKNPMSSEFLEASLVRLRVRLTHAQDEMDITSFAIRAIEEDLKSIALMDQEANNAEEK